MGGQLGAYYRSFAPTPWAMLACPLPISLTEFELRRPVHIGTHCAEGSFTESSTKGAFQPRLAVGAEGLGGRGRLTDTSGVLFFVNKPFGRCSLCCIMSCCMCGSKRLSIWSISTPHPVSRNRLVQEPPPGSAAFFPRYFFSPQKWVFQGCG